MRGFCCYILGVTVTGLFATSMLTVMMVYAFLWSKGSI